MRQAKKNPHTNTNINICNIKRRVQTELSLGLCSKSLKAVSAQLQNLCKECSDNLQNY